MTAQLKITFTTGEPAIYQVSTSPGAFFHWCNGDAAKVVLIDLAFTAAAEVGEPEYLYDKQIRSLTKIEQVRAAERERCAQVADSFTKKAYDLETADEIAAAIRAMEK